MTTSIQPPVDEDHTTSARSAVLERVVVVPDTTSSSGRDLPDRSAAPPDDATIYQMSPNFRISEYPGIDDQEPSWWRLLTDSLWWRSTSNKLRWMVIDRCRSYYWQHFAAWLLLALCLSGPMYATGRSKDMPYIDALFYVASAISATGLATRDLSLESTGTPVLLFFCMIVSGAAFESFIPVCLRLFYIRKERAKISLDDEAAHAALNQDYRISCFLLGTIGAYWLLCQLVTFVVLGLYYQLSSAGSATMADQNTNAWWVSLFGAVSAFNDCGFFLFGTSLVPLQTQIAPLIFYGALILMGNALYPIFLRACLKLSEAVLRRTAWPLAGDLKALLRAPRSFTTHLFSSNHTWRLLLIQIVLTTTQTVLMIALPNGSAFAGLNDGYYFANALFQSISVRTAGLNSIPIGLLSIESLVVMIVMMYIAAYPVVASIRSTNMQQNSSKQTLEYQLRRLLMQDLMWIVFPWFFVTACEGYTNYADGFNALFEVVSAYGTVGLSLGVSNANYSFSGSFGVASKLMIILVMLLGRHRGMPDTFDAVFTPINRGPIEVKSRRSTEP